MRRPLLLAWVGLPAIRLGKNAFEFPRQSRLLSVHLQASDSHVVALTVRPGAHDPDHDNLAVRFDPVDDSVLAIPNDELSEAR